MKYLTLHIVKLLDVSAEVLKQNPEADKFSYKKNLLNCISIGNEGMDAIEMRKRLRLLDVIEPADEGTTIGFEDADHEKLKTLVDRPIYVHFTRTLLKFIDDVINANELHEVH